MNQLYNQVSGHIVGYIGFLTNFMPNYLIAVSPDYSLYDATDVPAAMWTVSFTA